MQLKQKNNKNFSAKEIHTGFEIHRGMQKKATSEEETLNYYRFYMEWD